MASRQLLSVGEECFRVGPWHADDRIAYLALQPSVGEPSVEGLHGCLERLAEVGYSSVITSALHPTEARAFIDAGFTEYDRLRVLAHDLHHVPVTRSLEQGMRLRRAHRRDREASLVVDGRAFPAFWRLDRSAMAEAEHATPVTRFRVATCRGQVVGYAITGRGSGQGFLQRLAIDPDSAGRGVGSALVLDSLRWAVRRRCRRVLVNTQQENRRALDLYGRLGFQETPTHLVVLHRPVP